MNTKEKYPAAWQFFGAYYSEDFVEISGGAEGAISDFLSAVNDEGKAELKRDIDLILQEGLTEEGLDSLLADIGCMYYPPDDWPSSAAWLQHILSRLE